MCDTCKTISIATGGFLIGVLAIFLMDPYAKENYYRAKYLDVQCIKAGKVDCQKSPTPADNKVTEEDK